MRDNLSQRHLCSTAPDTLACYPFVHQDPFIVQTAPCVYFVGNQPEFSVDVVEGEKGQTVKTVAVPTFASTGSIVLVNLATLECQTLSFDVKL